MSRKDLQRQNSQAFRRILSSSKTAQQLTNKNAAPSKQQPTVNTMGRLYITSNPQMKMTYNLVNCWTLKHVEQAQIVHKFAKAHQKPEQGTNLTSV